MIDDLSNIVERTKLYRKYSLSELDKVKSEFHELRDELNGVLDKVAEAKFEYDSAIADGKEYLGNNTFCPLRAGSMYSYISIKHQILEGLEKEKEVLTAKHTAVEKKFQLTQAQLDVLSEQLTELNKNLVQNIALVEDANISELYNLRGGRNNASYY